jgi:hypothetical protein
MPLVLAVLIFFQAANAGEIVKPDFNQTFDAVEHSTNPPDLYGSLSKCFENICGKESTSPSEEDPDRDRRLRPVRDSLKAYIESGEALRKIFRDAVNRSAGKGEPIPVTSRSALMGLVGEMREPMKELALGALQNGTVKEADAQQLAHEKWDDEGGIGENLSKLFVKLAKDNRIVVTTMNELGAPYKYKFIYPNDDFQSAARRDLQETAQAVRRAPQMVRDLLKTVDLENQLQMYSRKHAPRESFVDELEGAQIQAVTDRIQWILRTHSASQSTPRLARNLHHLQTAKVRDVLTSVGENFEMPEEEKDDLPEAVTKMPMGDLARNWILNMGLNNSPADKPVDPYYKPDLNFSNLSMAYASCVIELAESEMNLPEETDLKKFREALPQLRASIKEGLKGKFSHQTSAAIGKFVDNVQFSPPPAREGFLENARRFLDGKSKFRMRAVQEYRKNPERGLLMVSTEGEEIEGTIGHQLQRVCRSLVYRPVRDNTVQSLGAVAVGSKSVKRRQFGDGACAHEVGHGLFHLLSTGAGISAESGKKFSDSKQCLVDGHRKYFDGIAVKNFKKPDEEKDKRSRDHYLSEDFADMVAAVSAPKGNFWCESGMPGTDLENYWNEKQYPVHSVSSFRLLNIETNSARKLDPSCAKFLGDSKADIKKCL